jgi:hypothetical protein
MSRMVVTSPAGVSDETRAARARSTRQRPSLPGPLIAVTVASGGAGLLAGDWLAAAGIWVLWAAWHYLPRREGPPVLPMAFTFQWVQVMAGLYYFAFTGQRLPAMVFSDYRTMVLLGLGSLLALLIGLKGGLTLIGQKRVERHPPVEAFSWPALIGCYLVFLAATGTVQELAWRIPALTQGILALTYGRFALLFLMFRRLSQPRVRVGWIGILLGGEVLLGFTGYFAGFREPMMLAAMALTGTFDPRRLRHWVALVLLGLSMVATGVMWMGVRTEYRRDFEDQVFASSREARLERFATLSSRWAERSPGEIVADIDLFVDRLWAIYYPALAVERVPAVIPYENGALLWRAIAHVLTPRFLFADKPVVESPSEMVRKYAGVWVAGPSENTSIAFGYAAESYVDFGVPLMFLPVLVYGFLMGMAYQWWFRLVRIRELATASAAVIFWLALYLFERSWINMLGLTVTLFAYLGGAVILVDRLLLRPRVSRVRARRSFAERWRVQSGGLGG